MYLLPKQQMFTWENREEKKNKKTKPSQIHLTRGISLVRHITKHEIQFIILFQRRTGSEREEKGKDGQNFLNCSSSYMDAKTQQETVYNNIPRFAHDTKFFLIMKYCAIYTEEIVNISQGGIWEQETGRWNSL